MRSWLVQAAFVASALEAGATAQVSWSQVASAGPAARAFSAMAFDIPRGRTVVFGGSNPGGMLSDTWLWDGLAWVHASSSGPVGRQFHAMAHDNLRGRVVLHGGRDANMAALDDTWEWDGVAWAQRAVSGAGARLSHAMAYDSQRGRVVLFGGGNGMTLSDTWEWDGSVWVLRSASGPTGRAAHAMAYDSLRGRTVLYGGFLPVSTLRDTWEWDGQSWVEIVTASSPGPRMQHAMAYDAQRGKTVLFGGSSYCDTWEWTGSQWTQVATAGPQAVHGSAMAYDAGRGKVVLFGGQTSGGAANVGETWEWGIPFGTATSFGAGCGNPAPVLTHSAGARPTIGTVSQALLANVPSSLAFVALGWSRTSVGPFALPLPLIGYGMPGCYMLQSSEAAAQPVSFTGPGTATYSLLLPNWSGLIGLRLYLQGWANAPGANAASVVVSNGLEWVIGY